MSTRVISAVPTAWIRPPTMPGPVRFSLFVLGVHLLTLLPVAVPGLSVAQAVSGFLILSFIPGYLLVSYVLDEFTLTGFLYAVGFSVAFSMFVGSAANLLYLGLNTAVLPFEQPTTSILYVWASAMLSILVWTLTDPNDTQTFRVRFPDYDVRVLALLASVPAFAVTGATFINRYAFNELTLFAIVCIALVPVAVYAFDKRGTYYPIAIAAVSSALLLQNTVIMTYLGRGDGLGEYEYANAALQNGFWIPAGTFGSMPRIVTLQSAYSLLTDTSLLWVFKLAHPILFVTVPLITYVIAARYFSKDIAFLSATLYIFLPRTYQIISRNTRTGGAIMFTALLLLAILDTDLPTRLRQLFVLTFFVGVLMSHYGVSTLVVFALVVAYVANVLAAYLLDNKRSSDLSFRNVALFGVLFVVWYEYMTDGVYDFLVGAFFGQISGSLFFTQESTAVRSVQLATESTGGAFGMPSGSYEVMFVGHLLLGVFTSIGISLVYLRYFGHGIPYLLDIQRWIDRNVFPGLSDDVLEDSNYVHLAVGMFLFFPLSFGPQILSAGRTFALVMVIVAPLPVLVLRSMRFERIGSKPALGLLVAFLLVTSGFVSAAATHDVSPQPTIDGERIVESGSTQERFAYYRESMSRNSIVASNFMLAHMPDGATIQRTQQGKFTGEFYTGDRRANIGFTALDNSAESASGYVYLSEPDTVSGTNTRGHLGFVFYTYDPLPSYTGSNTVYTTGHDRVHFNAN
ncbi:DUF2206 domain-containing protein [Halorubrum ezzemoulense]|uniref:DUF2206 domain-containing protein n=1 Tax=Halorubrum ezzemoulense TaxID=337243 RepID=UPI00232BCF84|nr:DUF2206 domain-containing protein [Halorubrum ezzemoulense]MDB2282666.1 DUF2206 domain-containing protein [Halorubrum ezzemoulense]